MADNKLKRGYYNDQLIDLSDKNQVAYIHFLFPDKECSQIIDAIKVAGPEQKK